MKAKLFISLLFVLFACTLRSQSIDSVRTFKYTNAYLISNISDKGVEIKDMVFCDTLGSTVVYDQKLANFEITINNHLEVLQNIGNFPESPNVYKLVAADGAHMIIYIYQDYYIIQTSKLVFKLSNTKTECK